MTTGDRRSFLKAREMISLDASDDMEAVAVLPGSLSAPASAAGVITPRERELIELGRQALGVPRSACTVFFHDERITAAQRVKVELLLANLESATVDAGAQKNEEARTTLEWRLAHPDIPLEDVVDAIQPTKANGSPTKRRREKVEVPAIESQTQQQQQQPAQSTATKKEVRPPKKRPMMATTEDNTAELSRVPSPLPITRMASATRIPPPPVPPPLPVPPLPPPTTTTTEVKLIQASERKEVVLDAEAKARWAMLMDDEGGSRESPGESPTQETKPAAQAWSEFRSVEEQRKERD
jgi:hypothetical protein